MSNYDVNESSAETSEPTSTAKCPAMGTAGGASAELGTTNNDWWPNQISVDPLLKGNPKSDPYEEGFDYVEAFGTLDLSEVKDEIAEVMKTSVSWWPADYGHYGPFFIRMAWHAAGTYRVSDGRGGGGEGLQRLLRSTRGQTTSTSTRLAVYFGQSRRSMDVSSAGLT